MAETMHTEATDADGATNGSKVRRSKREFIDGNGEVCSIEKCVGARYTVVHNGAVTKAFEREFGPAGEASTMFAAFGYHTKLGNVLNGIVNGDDYDGSDPSPAIEAWLELMDSDEPQWSERKAGVGSRSVFDKRVWAEVLSEQPGATLDSSGYLARLESKEKDDIKWYAKVRSRASLLQAYYEKVGSTSDDDASDLL